MFRTKNCKCGCMPNKNVSAHPFVDCCIDVQVNSLSEALVRLWLAIP